jgi:hypothetical protein
VTCGLRSYLVAPLWPCRTLSVSFTQKRDVQVMPLAAQVSDHYLRTGGELSSSGCAFHPGERPTRTGLRCRSSTMARSRRTCPCAAGPPVVIGREFSPHRPNAIPRWTTCSLKVVHLRASEVAVSHNRPPAASPRLASVTVGRHSAAPSGDVNLHEAAAGWTSQLTYCATALARG